VDDINIQLAAEIVAAYVSNNSVAAVDLPEMITDVHSILKRLASGKNARAIVEVELVSAVPVRKSITPDFIISLEDGKGYRSLKRHLMSKYQMTRADYRAKCGLADNYLMVAPNYAKQLRNGEKDRLGTGSQIQK
jgi:predicted transcriptional regulator